MCSHRTSLRPSAIDQRNSAPVFTRTRVSPSGTPTVSVRPTATSPMRSCWRPCGRTERRIHLGAQLLRRAGGRPGTGRWRYGGVSSTWRGSAARTPGRAARRYCTAGPSGLCWPLRQRARASPCAPVSRPKTWASRGRGCSPSRRTTSSAAPALARYTGSPSASSPTSPRRRAKAISRFLTAIPTISRAGLLLVNPTPVRAAGPSRTSGRIPPGAGGRRWSADRRDEGDPAAVRGMGHLAAFAGHHRGRERAGERPGTGGDPR
jgi:hypothetical protein